MKYIRTKDDKIYEIIDETENSFELCGPFEKKMGCSCTMIKRLLGSNEKPTYRLADTIEELCDEFVIYDIHKKKWLHFIDLKSLLSYCEENGLDKTQIRGAVWTEWGLKYIAKMNSNGELELL